MQLADDAKLARDEQETSDWHELAKLVSIATPELLALASAGLQRIDGAFFDTAQREFADAAAQAQLQVAFTFTVCSIPEPSSAKLNTHRGMSHNKHGGGLMTAPPPT